MARLKRCKSAGQKGHKTILKLGSASGVGPQLIAERGARVKTPLGRRIRTNKRSRRSKREWSHEKWIRYALKRKLQTYAYMTRRVDVGVDRNHKTESVLARRWKENQWEYLVKWQGYTEQTWEPLENLTSQPDGAFNEDLIKFLQARGYTIHDKPEQTCSSSPSTTNTASSPEFGGESPQSSKGGAIESKRRRRPNRDSGRELRTSSSSKRLRKADYDWPWPENLSAGQHVEVQSKSSDSVFVIYSTFDSETYSMIHSKLAPRYKNMRIKRMITLSNTFNEHCAKARKGRGTDAKTKFKARTMIVAYHYRTGV